MISVEGVSKRFGAVQAVRNVSFDARDGEITGLLGPNGAGKTTTLRMLYSLLPPDQGRIVVDGESLAPDKHALRASLGVVPDAKGLYQRLSARENITYFGRLHGLPEALIAQRLEQMAATLDMGEFLDRRCHGFSQGQRVKVAIARALIHAPQNVLLDEPSNGLDVMSTRALRAFILQMRDAGRCVIFSSHIMQEVAALCDRIVIVADGAVVAQGSAQELLQQSGQRTLEDAFVEIIGAGAEGLLA
jgi:sodium transport system ATP-binding protein